MPTSLTVGQLIDRYLTWAVSNAVHTAEAHSERVRTLTAFRSWSPRPDDPPLSGWLVDACSAWILEDFLAAHPQWRSTSTRKAKVNQINAVFNWAIRGKRIKDNPFSGIRTEEAPPRPPLPDNVLAQVLAGSNKRYERFVSFLRLTGRRLSEVAKLEWKHVFWDVGAAVLPASLHKAGKRTGRPLTIPLVEEALELLKKIKEEDFFEGVIFRNNRGLPWTRRALGLQFRRLKDRLGLNTNATLHGIRHQVGTTAVQGGASMKYVSKSLGHSSQAITEKYYVHVDQDLPQMKDAMRASLNQRKGIVG